MRSLNTSNAVLVARLQIVELDVLMHEIANSLHAAPSRRARAERIPGGLAQSIGFAVAAAHEIDEAFIGQVGGRNLPCVRNGRLGLTGILDRRVAPERQIAGRRYQPQTFIAERIAIGRRWNDGRGEDPFGDANCLGVIVMHRKQADQRRRPRAVQGDFVAVADQHQHPRNL